MRHTVLSSALPRLVLAVRAAVACTVACALAAGPLGAQAGRAPAVRPPIIDMHMHAASVGPGGPAAGGLRE